MTQIPYHDSHMSVTQLATAWLSLEKQYNEKIPHEVIVEYLQKAAEVLKAPGLKLPNIKNTGKPMTEEEIQQTYTDDYVVCLEDGKTYQTLTRTLTKLGLTPLEYKKKWGLPVDYSCVAKNYSKKRSKIASEKNAIRYKSKQNNHEV